jgi:hypothetical protein
MKTQLSWHSIKQPPLRSNCHVIVFTPSDKGKDKFRVVESQFVRTCTDATLWSYLKEPKEDEKDYFTLADKVIREAYPGDKKGMWGEQHIPNFGILRGAIEKALRTKE